MDLNYLFYRHQRSIVEAGRAVSREARCAHRGLANGYARQIADLQAHMGATFPAPVSI